MLSFPQIAQLLGFLLRVWDELDNVRFGAGMFVPRQGAAARCCCQSAVCLELVYCFSVLLLEWRVRCGAGLPEPVQGAVAGYWCQTAVCILGS